MLSDEIRDSWEVVNEQFWREKVQVIKRWIAEVDNIDDRIAECKNAQWKNALECSSKCEEEYPPTIAD